MRRSRTAALVAVLALASLSARAEEAVRVFAAASLTKALNEVAAAWQQQGHPAPVVSYAGSATLARQIVAGAPADVFASAHRSWMDHVEQHGKIQAGTRSDLLGNRLVLIVPKGERFDVKMERGLGIAEAFDGKLCTGEPGVVPVGIYAKDSLQALGWWDALSGRIVGTQDVRAALAFVERGECAAGIVYATDAAISEKVEVLERFPEDTHKPIVYPFALIAGARPEAAAFLDYLRSPQAAAAFARCGFSVLAKS